MKPVAILLLIAGLGVGSTAALAQQSSTTKSDKGNASSVPAGQGGTAGTHDTGPHASPSRAGQVKTPGN
jgi:hypothetical protein